MAVKKYKARLGAGSRLRNMVICTDENYVVDPEDEVIQLKITGAGARTLTFPTASPAASEGASQVVRVMLTEVAGGGTYTTVNVLDGNQVLFDAAGEAAIFASNDVGGFQVIAVGLPAPTRP